VLDLLQNVFTLVAMAEASAVTSCSSTIWDLHWHPSVRSIVRAFCRGAFYDELYEALEAAKCTTVETLKQLTADSPCLAAMTELRRAELLAAAARMPAGKRMLAKTNCDFNRKQPRTSVADGLYLYARRSACC
jgi:hypothetical protein